MADRDELLRMEEAAWTAFVAEVRRVPEHVRGLEGVVPGWSVNDLVYHAGKWASVATEKLDAIRAGEHPTSTGDTWPSMNEEWAAESKSISYEEAMSSAVRERERAREALLAMDDVHHDAASWFREETTDHYAEHAEEIARFADSLGPGDAGHEPRIS
jgi:hypothetical protein